MKEIQLLNKDNDLKEASLQKERVIKYGLLLMLVVITVFGFLAVRAYRQKQKANLILASQKEEINRQKHLIEEKQKEIVDSINYAKRIQYTLLASKDLINSGFARNFVLFKPKDIVSGDFYWATEYKNRFYLAVCDSTGHGVPGAFMSLLNIGFLSEAIKEKNISKPNEIFNYVRMRLIESVSKEGQKDGMDGILLCLNKEDGTLSYASAHNSPVLIINNEIIETETDKMPIGKGEKDTGFSLFEISAREEKMIYLYTDGYADQFGGPKGKKFKYKPLNALLQQIAHLEPEAQKEILNKKFEEWKGDLEQVDDVCVIGIKV